ncbi:hypothetical protein ACIQRS_21655 [Streptomyces termitum]|uniref:Membrane protein n=1 Tax=Streptomyces termitum TaxID=67368 RepID=A0A918WBT2_9ACTN|nr:hypothetical protein [Streptomyces termitum]GHA92093.1 membrane protein [Streptomyces termitum]
MTRLPADTTDPETIPETGPETDLEADSGKDADTAPRAGRKDPEPRAGAEPGDTPEDPESDGADGEDDGERRRTRTRRTAVVVTAVVALLLGGGAFFHAAHQLRSTPSAQNRALTDTEATTRVGGDVAEGLARIFSYTPAGTDSAERSARTVLTGRAARQYQDLIAQVRTGLAGQKVSLTTQAVRTGVVELDGDRARVLVFLDQTSRRGKGATSSVAAQLTVTARFDGERWLIADIKAR